MQTDTDVRNELEITQAQLRVWVRRAAELTAENEQLRAQLAPIPSPIPAHCSKCGPGSCRCDIAYNE